MRALVIITIIGNKPFRYVTPFNIRNRPTTNSKLGSSFCVRHLLLRHTWASPLYTFSIQIFWYPKEKSCVMYTRFEVGKGWRRSGEIFFFALQRFAYSSLACPGQSTPLRSVHLRAGTGVCWGTPSASPSFQGSNFLLLLRHFASKQWCVFVHSGIFILHPAPARHNSHSLFVIWECLTINSASIQSESH